MRVRPPPPAFSEKGLAVASILDALRDSEICRYSVDILAGDARAKPRNAGVHKDDGALRTVAARGHGIG